MTNPFIIPRTPLEDPTKERKGVPFAAALTGAVVVDTLARIIKGPDEEELRRRAQEEEARKKHEEEEKRHNALEEEKRKDAELKRLETIAEKVRGLPKGIRVLAYMAMMQFDAASTEARADGLSPLEAATLAILERFKAGQAEDERNRQAQNGGQPGLKAGQRLA